MTTRKIKCATCGKEFNKLVKHLNYEASKLSQKNSYCTSDCAHKANITRQMVACKNCGKPFVKYLNQIKKSKYNFCNRSCAATYNNTHKTKGTKRSKLEIFIEKRLKFLFPKIEFHFNKIDAIQSELDIYIPSLKLAFELNGIFHYEPIFGQDKLSSTQNNDNRKFLTCLEKGIELCIIDVSGQKYFKEATSQKYLDIIIDILNYRA